MDGGISAVGSIFNASWRIATVIYELKAVGEQTRDLLDTTSQVSSTLQHAQVLRRQRSGLLSGTEKKWIDDVLQASDKAVGNVAALIEPARVDMQTRCNKIRFATRGQFILRDSPKVGTQLHRLSIAHQGLNSAMVTLCNRDGSISSPTDGGIPQKVDSGATDNDLKPPPSYEVVELLDRRRQTMLKRRASKLPMVGNLDAEVNRVKPLEEDPNPLPMVSVAEVQETPVTSPQPNLYAESDGLQVVENILTSNPRPSFTPDRLSRGPCPTYSMSGTTSADHFSRSHSPYFPTVDLNTTYIPYRPPGPPDPPPQHYTPQPPTNNSPYLPYSAASSSSFLSSSTTLNPQYHRPPDPPSPYQPYSNPVSTTAPPPPPPPQQPTMSYNHISNHNYNYNYNPISPAQPTPTSATSDPNITYSYCRSPDTMASQLDPYSRPPSCSSIATRESVSAVPRQKGRARGRAWLEHQSGK
jgi:hypothetical protein